jgi:hypothetical protein
MKTLNESTSIHEKFHSAAAIEDQFWGQKSLFWHPTGMGNFPGAISIDSTAISIAVVDSHDEERVVLPRG